MLYFYTEQLFAYHKSPKQEDQPLSAVHNCLFIIFIDMYAKPADFLLQSQPENLPCYVDKGPS
jgi:hypothetical protein